MTCTVALPARSSLLLLLACACALACGSAAASHPSPCAYRDPVSGAVKDLWTFIRNEVQPKRLTPLGGDPGADAFAVFCADASFPMGCDTPAGTVNDSMFCLRDESGNDVASLGSVPSGGYEPEYVSHNASAFDLVFRNGQPCGPAGKPSSVTYEYRCAEDRIIWGDVRAAVAKDSCSATVRVQSMVACSDPPPCGVRLPPYGITYDFSDVAETYKFNGSQYGYGMTVSLCPGEPVDPWETACARANASVCLSYDGLTETLARPGGGNWTVPGRADQGLQVVYTNGEACGTNEPYTVTIRYVCAFDGGPTGVVSFANSGCSYTIVAATQGACPQS